MAHIANKIDAKDKKLQEIFHGNRYKIDVFQREYRWQREQIEALISDLSSSFFNNYDVTDSIENASYYDCYYMGPIVLCEDDNSLSIVDGQQRLTSFTLLIIYLNHLQNTLNLPEELKQDLENYIYVKKAGKKTLVLNIESRNSLIEELIHNPDILYTNSEELIQSSLLENFDDFKIEESLENIKGRYEDIIRFFPPELRSIEILPIFIEWFLNRIVLVEIKAYNLENAYTIFETMNDRGLSLNPTEILKAFLLSNIKDDQKAEEANEVWKNLINELKNEIGQDADLDFFRAWFRGKYAITKRGTSKGSENEDFEKIGVQFHSWIKTNSKKINLKQPNDFYYFILSDLKFYIENYTKLYDYKNYLIEGFEEINITNHYSIADSLIYPLFLSSILKTDDENEITIKFNLINSFIDKYTNIRMIFGRPITQSSIRNYFYDLIKDIRGKNIEEIKYKIENEILKLKDTPEVLSPFQKMDNWGYYHYFFARILHHIDSSENFIDLLRNRKQNSYILIQIFTLDDLDDNPFNLNYVQSIGNFCLIRRYHSDEFFKKPAKQKVNFLHKNNYLIEHNYDKEMTPSDFIDIRNREINNITESIWFNDSSDLL